MHYALIRGDGTFEIYITPPDAPKIVSMVPLADGALPDDRTFRNAWTLSGDSIVIDMDKAREIWRAKVKWAHDTRMVGLDRIHARLTEDAADELLTEAERKAKADDAAQVDRDRNALNRVLDDPAIAAATTPAELRAFWPDILGTNPPR